MRRCWPVRRRSNSADQDSAWNRFVHQELKGYSPIMTGNRVLAFFLVATVLLIPLGAAILAASLSVTEYKIRYDNVGTGFDSNDKSVQQRALWAGAGNQSTVTFTTTKRLKAPVSGTPKPCVLLQCDILGVPPLAHTKASVKAVPGSKLQVCML